LKVAGHAWNNTKGGTKVRITADYSSKTAQDRAWYGGVCL
jgi:hypothetical protein